MNSKTIFALLLSGIAIAAHAQTNSTSTTGTSTYGVNTTTNTGTSNILNGLGSTTSTTGNIKVHSFGQAHIPPVVTPEPVTMLAFLPGVLFLVKRRKNNR